MQTTVTFERVFDIQRRHRTKHQSQRTEFSFVANGKPHYGVTVVGWPTLAVGTTITALLRKSNNWQTLAGWYNHQTGELVVPAYGISIFHALTTGVFAWMCGILFFGAQSYLSTSAGRTVAGTFVALLAVLAAMLAQQSYRQRKEAITIRSFVPHHMATPPVDA